MGQRLLVRSKRRAGSKTGVLVAVQPASLSVFDTELGWFGLVGRGEMVMRLFLGHASAEQVRSAAARAAEPHASGRLLPESDWNPKLRRALQDFARGVPTDFADVKLDLEEGSPVPKAGLAARPENRLRPDSHLRRVGGAGGQAGVPRGRSAP